MKSCSIIIRMKIIRMILIMIILIVTIIMQGFSHIYCISTCRCDDDNDYDDCE